MVAWRGVADLTRAVAVVNTVQGLERRAHGRMISPGVREWLYRLGRSSDGAPRRGASEIPKERRWTQ